MTRKYNKIILPTREESLNMMPDNVKKEYDAIEKYQHKKSFLTKWHNQLKKELHAKRKEEVLKEKEKSKEKGKGRPSNKYLYEYIRKYITDKGYNIDKMAYEWKDVSLSYKKEFGKDIIDMMDKYIYIIGRIQ